MARDLDDFLARSGGEEKPGQGERAEISETRIVGLRRAIAERMEKASRIPHFSYVEEFDLTELEGLRRSLNDEEKPGRPKLTLLPFLMRGLVRLIPEFPQFNAHYDDTAGLLRSHRAIHIGIATQTDDGLMVPVVRHAEALDLWQSARELQRVISAARQGKAKREELSGSTITLTSLGALGGIAATPIINHPEVAILGPNKLVERPMVIGGQMTVRTMMNLSASFDHRIIDGYDAARFVQALKRLLERPALLFIDET
jgi:2-oxoisovalerate dehydrogenase E2 component (dihydrolipoyl transacylase)